MGMRARHLVPVLAVALLSAAAGCGGPPATRAPSGPPGAYIGTRALEPAATEDNRFHDGDLRAVVSVADAVALVEVLDQEERTTDASDEDGGDITTWTTRLRVREVLWRRPGAPEPTPTVTAHDLFRRPLSGYLLVPLVRERTWYPLTSSSYVTVTQTAKPPADGPNAGWAGDLTGTRVDRLGGRLRRTAPWPGATPEAPLADRADAVLEGLYPAE